MVSRSAKQTEKAQMRDRAGHFNGFCFKCGFEMSKESGYFQCLNGECRFRFYGDSFDDPYVICVQCGCSFPGQVQCPNCGLKGE